MPKRKSSAVEEAEVTPRRSTRHKSFAPAEAAATLPATKSPAPVVESKPKKAGKPKVAAKAKAPKEESKPASTTAAPTSAKGSKGTPTTANTALANGTTSSTDKLYWLMKAEPDSRLENGVDVKFSIDDLAARTEPEPWDGIRAYPARNNLRAMKKGDLAFFYHSNCKEPGIVGTMEIVQEHSPDLSAHDPKAPYYDASSKPSDPKWSVVHVKFRSKFDVPITLKELREMGTAGKPLENMQMLKQTRLSVSKVSAAEWEYLMGVAEDRVKP